MLANTIEELRVLVAVPNEQVAVGIKNMLRLQKARRAVIALNSSAAIHAMAQDRRFNLFFIAENLKEHGGVDFCRFIRMTDTPMSKADMILYLPVPTQELVTGAQQAGINKVMVGQITGQAVLGQIQDVIANRRSFVVSGGYNGPDRRRDVALKYEGQERRQLSK